MSPNPEPHQSIRDFDLKGTIVQTNSEQSFTRANAAAAELRAEGPSVLVPPQPGFGPVQTAVHAAGSDAAPFNRAPAPAECPANREGSAFSRRPGSAVGYAFASR